MQCLRGPIIYPLIPAFSLKGEGASCSYSQCVSKNNTATPNKAGCLVSSDLIADPFQAGQLVAAVKLHFKESVNTLVTEEFSQGAGRELHLASVFCAHDYILCTLLIIGKIFISRNGQPKSNIV